ncbi:PfkB family carbohydrate kinase [Vaginisenegalia massiliensis]|uniref:PfkB family carbohydrate kinase n=1 Tax=Vaginisenegalia massiliensis TaxID=2058294 RepID=UPI000F531A08|nr:PfkB family carbohydrate kinase [Vaginisenegalia massiliensis]
MDKCMVIGSTVCDIMIYVDRLPGREGDVHISKQTMAVGGCAFNSLNILHHLNIPYTFISPVGTGLYGDFVAKNLKQLGIKSEIRSDLENGCCYCFVEEDGERSFISYHKVEYSFNPSWLDSFDLDEYAYIYVCGLEIEEEDGPALVEALSRFKGQIFFCPGPRAELINPELMQKMYALSPILHINEQEIMRLATCTNVEAAVLKLAKQTQRPIIVTLGSEGALLFEAGEFKRISGYPNQVVDTIGAGDSHAGAVIAALYSGMTLSHAVDFANQVSSLVVGTSGVQLAPDQYQRLKEKLNTK